MQVQPPALRPPEPLSCIETAMQGLARRIRAFIEPLLIHLGCVAAPPLPTPAPAQAPESPAKIKVLPPTPPSLSAPSPQATPTPPDFSFELQLLSGLRLGSIAPTMVFKHFEYHLPPAKQAKIFERLGREAALSISYRVLSALSTYQEIGMNQARLNPYLLAPYLEKAIRKKIS